MAPTGEGGVGMVEIGLFAADLAEEAVDVVALKSKRRSVERMSRRRQRSMEKTRGQNERENVRRSHKESVKGLKIVL